MYKSNPITAIKAIRSICSHSWISPPTGLQSCRYTHIYIYSTYISVLFDNGLEISAPSEFNGGKFDYFFFVCAARSNSGTICSGEKFSVDYPEQQEQCLWKRFLLFEFLFVNVMFHCCEHSGQKKKQKKTQIPFSLSGPASGKRTRTQMEFNTIPLNLNPVSSILSDLLFNLTRFALQRS